MHEHGDGGRLILPCGLPGSGKTTLAKRLEREVGALRLCPDEWMRELAIDLWDGPARERVHALQWRVAQDALRLGCTVIIEWGMWNRAERDTIRLACRAMGVGVELRHLDVPIDVLVARVEARQRVEPLAIAIERRHFEEWVTAFDAPDAQELALFDPPLNP